VQPSSQARQTGTDVAAAARLALDRHVVVARQDVQLRVEHGEVTPEGDVEWQFQRQGAGSAVAQVPGVTKVHTLMTLRPGALAEDIQGGIEAAFRRCWWPGRPRASPGPEEYTTFG
jgi:BON domain